MPRATKKPNSILFFVFYFLCCFVFVVKAWRKLARRPDSRNYLLAVKEKHSCDLKLFVDQKKRTVEKSSKLAHRPDRDFTHRCNQEDEKIKKYARGGMENELKNV